MQNFKTYILSWHKVKVFLFIRIQDQKNYNSKQLESRQTVMQRMHINHKYYIKFKVHFIHRMMIMSKYYELWISKSDNRSPYSLCEDILPAFTLRMEKDQVKTLALIAGVLTKILVSQSPYILMSCLSNFTKDCTHLF
jgi:hypothetical protein